MVSYNTREILEDCINNLRGKYPNMELIVVDNDSPDNSAEMVEKEFMEKGYDWVSLVESENKGLAHGYNLGLEKSTAEYILFLGADTFPEEETLLGMVDWMEKEENKDVGIATAKLIQRDGEIDWDAHRGFPYPWAAITHFLALNKIFNKSKFFNKYFMGWKDLDSSHEIDLCISHFMLVRRNVFETIGGWDEGFWLYGEDVDICWRAKEAGFRVYYLASWEAIHYKGSSIGVRESSKDVSKASYEDKFKSYKASAVSMKKFYKKHWKNKYPKILTASIFFAINILGKFRLLKLKLLKG